LCWNEHKSIVYLEFVSDGERERERERERKKERQISLLLYI
jgi:hypothetical protein